MRKVYIDAEFKCHATDNGTMTVVETDYFDNKCDTFIEGYRFVPAGQSWTREDGEVFHGEMITPLKDCDELDRIQQDYEKQQLEEYKAIVAEQDIMILDLQYNALVEGL